MLDRFLALARRFRRRRKFLENEGEGFSLPLTLLYIYYSLHRYLVHAVRRTFAPEKEIMTDG